MQGLTRLSTRILAEALGAAAPAWSISLGDVDVRSALGEPLDVRVPLALAPGEDVDAACFGLARDGEAGLPLLTEGSLSLERAADRTALRIRSSGPIFEPALRVRVRAGCPGQAAEPAREYSILLDARRGDPVVADVPAIATTLAALSGDTLQGLAAKVFPRNRAARNRYLQAMREANPALASLGDTDPITEGANVALPDLRTFGRGLRIAKSIAHAPRGEPPTREKTQAAPQAKTEAASHETAARARTATQRKSTGHAATSPPAPQPTASPRTAPTRGDFVLRLSTGSMDLARSRDIDDRTRADLRERLMILESDDQVAAVLALRHRLTQLEQRVSDLQLKLAQMPAAFPERPAAQPAEPAPRKAAAAPAPVAQPPKPVEPPQLAVAESPKPVAVEPPKPTAEPAKPVPAQPSTSTVPLEAASPRAEPAPTPPSGPESATLDAKTDAAKSAPAASSAAIDSTAAPPASTPAAAKPRKASAEDFDLASLWQSYGLWAALAAILALLAVLFWRFSRRSEPEYESDEEAWEAPAPTEPRLAEAAEDTTYDPDATLALEPPDAAALRKRYIEERFPEVTNGTLALDDPASVVKNARLLYEDGAAPRAIELLSLAIEERPREVRPWLALFEIHRLERMTAEFAELARRFFEQFGGSEHWRKVRYFGREIDPGNFVYREDVDAIETITPAAARRERERFDPVRENWLEVPMGFDDQVLANELRQALMAGAGVVDQDLVPNPMPALRDAEMFTVA